VSDTAKNVTTQIRDLKGMLRAVLIDYANLHDHACGCAVDDDAGVCSDAIRIAKGRRLLLRLEEH